MNLPKYLPLPFTIIIAALFVYCGCGAGIGVTQIQLSGNPAIEFTKIPSYNSYDDLEGRVYNAEPDSFCVAVYIYVSGWWTKPYWIRPKTRIQKDRTWKCDVTTGGKDEKATRLAAFLTPKAYNPPLMYGEIDLPEEIYQNSVAMVETKRVKK